VRNKTANIYISFQPIEGDPGVGGEVGEALSPTPFRDPPSSYIRLDSREPWNLRHSSGKYGMISYCKCSYRVLVHNSMCYKKDPNFWWKYENILIISMFSFL